MEWWVSNTGLDVTISGLVPALLTGLLTWLSWNAFLQCPSACLICECRWLWDCMGSCLLISSASVLEQLWSILNSRISE